MNTGDPRPELIILDAKELTVLLAYTAIVVELMPVYHRAVFNDLAIANLESLWGSLLLNI